MIASLQITLASIAEARPGAVIQIPLSIMFEPVLGYDGSLSCKLEGIVLL